MQDPAQSQRLRIVLLCAAGLLTALIVGWNIGSSNYGLLLLGAIAVVGFFITFAGRFFWILTIASAFLTGTFPILRGSFTPFEILMAIGVGKFLVEDVVFKRTRFHVGNRIDLLLIAGLMGILTIHGVHDRFGMRFLGSHVWGGRNYVNVYVGLLAFFVIQSVRMPAETWKKLPYFILAVTGFDLFIAIITTIFPRSIYTIYPFYSAVSMTGIEQILGESDITGRIGSFGNFGFILILIVLASTRLQNILHPSNFGRLALLLIGFASTLISGFRTSVINAAVGFLAAGIRDLKYGAIALLPFLAFVLFGLALVNSTIVPLPKQIQRAISFVPGHWDYDMAQDAAFSDEYRRNVWTLWERQYFRAQPLLGRGFGFQSQWADPLRIDPRAIDYQQTVEVGNIHNGLFSALDGFGLVGALFFVLWVLRVLTRALKVPFQADQPNGMVVRFVALYLVVWVVTYWFGAQTLGLFLPLQFALTAVLLRLQGETASAETKRAPAGKIQRAPGRELVRI